MPELPEVEVLVRHLAPLLVGQTIHRVQVHRPRSIRPDSTEQFTRRLVGRTFLELTRRAKFLVFTLGAAKSGSDTVPLLGHLGMTGRMYLQPTDAPLPRHAAVSFDLGASQFVFEDTRYFGRMTLDTSSLEEIGPEPLSADFTLQEFHAVLKRSSQAIKVKLLDQTLVAGIGNIYASEALHRARIPPRLPAQRVTRPQATRLHSAIRDVLQGAIDIGSSLPLDFSGSQKRDGLFYYGQADQNVERGEQLLVYDREGRPCTICGTPIRRIVQAARSTFFCPKCQQR